VETIARTVVTGGRTPSEAAVRYNFPMLILNAFLSFVVLLGFAATPQRVSFPTPDGGVVYADVYGSGERGVVLAHGGQFNKESWEKQAQVLADAGFRVLAFDFRGYGQSRGPKSKSGFDGVEFDVLASVRYLHANGAKTVSVVGASFGGEAAADASTLAQPGEIDRLVLLAAWTGKPAEKIKGRKLFIVARDDSDDRLSHVRANYEKALEPKELIILDGSAHAQFLFATDQGERLMREILRFLSQSEVSLRAVNLPSVKPRTAVRRLWECFQPYS
jgi:pimeloyl-ACP methyl ester carboxylesterase